MKQWLGIFLLIWSTATMCSEEGRTSTPCRVEISATTLSEHQDYLAPPDTMPLLATATTASARYGNVETPTSGKGGRHTYAATAAALRGIPYRNDLSIGSFLTKTNTCSPTHNAGRYIYFLRRIII